MSATTRIDLAHATPESTPAKPPRGWAKLLLRVAVSVGLCAFLLSRVDLAKMLNEMAHMRWELWACGLAAHLFSQIASAVRWSGLAVSLGFRAPRWSCVRWYFEGMFFSLCLPSSIGGDLMRCYRLADTKNDGSSFRSRAMLAGCTVLADRVVGFLTLVSLGITAFSYETFSLSAPLALLMLAGTLSLAVLGLRIGASLLRHAPHWLARFPKLAGMADKLRPFGATPGVLERALAWSVAVQLLGMFTLAWVGMAMGLAVPVPAYFVAVAIISTLTMLPLSINGVGIREGGLTVLLAAHGVSSEDGITLGLLWFLVIVVAGLMGGVVYLTRDKSADLAVSASHETQAEPPRTSLAKGPTQTAGRTNRVRTGR